METARLLANINQTSETWSSLLAHSSTQNHNVPCIIRKIWGNCGICLKSQALSVSFERSSASALTLHALCFHISDGATWRHACWGVQSSGQWSVTLYETRVACALASQEVTRPRQSCMNTCRRLTAKSLPFICHSYRNDLEDPASSPFQVLLHY